MNIIFHQNPRFLKIAKAIINAPMTADAIAEMFTVKRATAALWMATFQANGWVTPERGSRDAYAASPSLVTEIVQ